MTRTTHRALLGVLLTAALATELLSGCASIMHGTSQDVPFETTPPGAVITAYHEGGEDSVKCRTPCSLKLPRKGRYFVAIRHPDYQPAGLYLRPRTSRWFYANVLLWSVPGFLVDHVGGGAYRFEPQRLSLDPSDSLGPGLIRGDSMIAASRAKILSRYSRKTRPVSYANKLVLSLTIPEGNWFYYLHSREHVNRFGFLGLLIGLEYYPADDYFYSMRLGVATNFMLPFPVVADYCLYEGVGAALLQLQMNRASARYTVGGGLHWLSFKYIRWVDEFFCGDDVPDVEECEFYGQSIGLSLSVQRYIGSGLCLGLNYLPTILLKDDRGFHLDYSHTIYLGLTVKMTAMSL